MLIGHANEAPAVTAAAPVVFSVAVALDLGAAAVRARVLDQLDRLLTREAHPGAARTRPHAFEARHLGSFAVFARMRRG